MKSQPLVSVILPTYNRNDLIVKSIDCLSNQSYKNIEVIVVDDGSVVPIELNNVTDLNIKLIRFHQNFGAGYARRKGRELAKGEFICYLDSDDWWDNNFIEECLNFLLSNPSVGMVYSNTVKIVDGEKINKRVSKYMPIEILPTLFKFKKRFWSTPSCMWRREVSLPEFWKNLRNHEDYVHDILCSKKNNRIAYVFDTITYNNHTSINRIVREKKEVEKSIKVILKMDDLPKTKGLIFFILVRMYDYNIKIRLKDLKLYFMAPFKEKELNIKLFLFYYFLLIMVGFMGLYSYRIKKYIYKYSNY